MANSKNCSIVADAIEASVTFNQRAWHSCNTPACVAGHTVQVLDPDFDHFCITFSTDYCCKVDGKIVKKLIAKEAGKLLGFDSDHDFELFEAKPFECTKITNMGAARVLRHFGETGKVNWRKANGEQ